MNVKIKKPCKKLKEKDIYVCADKKRIPGKVYRKNQKKSRQPSPPKPKPPKPPKPDKPDKPKKPKAPSGKGGTFLTPLHPFLPSRGRGRPTLNRLTNDQVLRARGIAGSKVFHQLPI